jgi:hypothetical protein
VVVVESPAAGASVVVVSAADRSTPAPEIVVAGSSVLLAFGAVVSGAVTSGTVVGCSGTVSGGSEIGGLGAS